MTQNDLHTFIRLFDSELRLYRPGWSSRIEGEGGNTARLWANGSTVGLDLLQDSVSPNPKPDPILQAVIVPRESVPIAGLSPPRVVTKVWHSVRREDETCWKDEYGAGFTIEQIFSIIRVEFCEIAWKAGP
jgi:hypothetical protein